MPWKFMNTGFGNLQWIETMDQFEEAVLNYICGTAERFVSAQFNVPYKDFQGGSCPDFVVVDFHDRTIYVVEVTQAADSKAVMERVANRETRWLNPLRSHFQNLSPLFKDWEFHVTVFLRDEATKTAQKAVANDIGISVISLDKVVFSWRWDWKDGRPSNPLRDPAKRRIMGA